MNTLKKYILDAQENKQAIPHFNVSNSDMLMAVFAAAQKVSEEAGEKIPVVIGVSEGERDQFGTQQALDYVRSLSKQHDYPLYINADHTFSVERTCEAIDLGYDMVIYDGNKVTHEENVVNTKKVVEYRNKVNPDCLVEAEFGNIGLGSGLKDSLPEGISEDSMTDPERAKDFVLETGVDLLAPAVGNVHGMVKSGNPALNPERVTQVLESAGIPLVLHGGSGSADEDFVKVIKAGISLIHISTELRVGYREGLETMLGENNEVAPYKYNKKAKDAVQAKAAERIRLFWGV
jgi:fructose-bisphosphate aldolase class II